MTGRCGPAVPGGPDVGEPVAAGAGPWWPARFGVEGCGRCPVQLTGAQLRELQAVPARALGVGRDQCWTLGRIGELVRRLSLAASIAVKPGKCPG